jgi:hypothetical protein
MVLDGGVVVAYLAASLARHVTDRTIGTALNRLTASVTSRLGSSWRDEIRSGDPNAGHRLAIQLNEARARDRRFDEELKALVQQLDRHDGRRFLTNVYAPGGRVTMGMEGAIVAGRDLFFADVDPQADLRRSPGWVKVMYVLGTLIGLCGFGIFGYVGFGEYDSGRVSLENPGSLENGFPPGLLAGAAVFFAGLVLTGIAKVAAGVTRRRF